jgi:hypothetical protein
VWQGWRVVGQPEFPLTPLAGDLEAELPRWTRGVRAQILKEAGAADRPRGSSLEACWPGPAIASNFFVRGGAGYNFETWTNGKDVGPEFFFELGIPLPIFDINAGNIAQAEAQLQLAREEVRRVELSLYDRLGGVTKNYRDA